LNSPPGWPPVPEGFVPPPGWQPDPAWPAPPPGWQLWLPEDNAPYPPYQAPLPYGGPAQPYGWPPSAPRPGSGLAISSLVLGILGFLGITSVLGVILGIVALVQIRAQRQRGKGLAIAGIAVSTAWIVLFASLVIAAAPSDSAALFPRLLSWYRGHREIACIVTSPAGNLDSSVLAPPAPAMG
ncbi:MAG TPA: DUF4190 domain-containing protein, partial [Streptosporangiaceae bacterium]|nr:DUF4190 domain-containing protein [Streptosporangiaceae bacterium]